MQNLVNSADKTIDVMDAGTTMRFLTAFFALTGKSKIITGTERMKQRPIALLVDALRQIGSSIRYVEKDGFPPLETQGFTMQQAESISIPGNVSSQYISALMMTAPVLPRGLTLTLEGKIGSRPYLDMTARLMKEFGVTVDFSGQTIRVPHAPYQATSVTIEADWSAASYWYAVTALAQTADIRLPNVSSASWQGDRVIVEIMEKLGVKTAFTSHEAHLTKKPAEHMLEWDFTACPDLAQTVLPVCAAKGITGRFTGLESLRIKETDRIAGLQSELAKLNATLLEESAGTWTLGPGKLPSSITVHTYHDHRMAMGFAPLATLMEVTIEDPEVVNKSYPGFWDDLRSVGFALK
jgi:3-phosphoshikimate 1-carboxyvinyltransferase